MKKTVFALSIFAGIILTSCGGGAKTDAPAADPAAASTPAAPAAPAAAAITVTEADWAPTDLKATSNLTPISLKLPKGVKLEKNGNGGVDATIGGNYTLVVYNTAISSVKEGVDGDKKMYVKNDATASTTVDLDEPNGFVYTTVYKGTDGKTFPAGTHFVYYYEQKGAGGSVFYSVHDEKASGASAEDAAFTPDLAKKVYGLVKSSFDKK
ncbi:MAG: hypothetical protein JWO03_763 [Bacteroidetes bacterium]|nr:hypothetical protein [Bacteroidota bacterium]